MSDDTEKFDPASLPTGDGMLRREHFSAEGLRVYKEMAARDGMGVMDDAAREATRRAVLAAVAPQSDVWVFGYGSLIWNPIIRVAESRVAHVAGFHRHFCLRQTVGRGLPDKPGLMLGLDAGGACTGVVHRVAAEDVESETALLWQREMLSGAYRPAWVEAETEGGTVRAIAFVVDRAHKRYEGVLPFETVAGRIAAAEGVLGTNRDYLYRTARHLEQLAIDDDEMFRLARRVRALTGEVDDQPQGET